MLNKNEIEGLIKESGLVSGYIDLETQLTPNGFDMTVEKIYEYAGEGALDFSNKERKLPDEKETAVKKKNEADKFGWWQLKKGAYKIKTNETVKLPNDLIAIAFTRSSLLRMGAFTQNGVWDAGFCGKSEFILVVENPMGIKIKQNARVIQLLFCKVNKSEHFYQGIYQNKS